MNRNSIIIDILLILPALYIIRVVYIGIKTGKAEVKEGIVYKKKKSPIAYWIVIIVQSMIAIALLCLLILKQFIPG